MTCIVGLVENGKIYLGGDSAGVSAEDIRLIDTPKVFQKQHLLIGYTWSFRMGQIIQYANKFPELFEHPDNYTYLIKSFVPFLRAELKDAGWLRTEDSRDEGGQFLVGIRSELFVVHSNFSVLRMMNNFNAIGSGSHYALGAMRILIYNTDRKPAIKVGLALEAASHFSTSVSGPYIIKEL